MFISARTFLCAGLTSISSKGLKIAIPMDIAELTAGLNAEMNVAHGEEASVEGSVSWSLCSEVVVEKHKAVAAQLVVTECARLLVIQYSQMLTLQVLADADADAT